MDTTTCIAECPSHHTRDNNSNDVCECPDSTHETIDVSGSP
jgi:hypothetical protein